MFLRKLLSVLIPSLAVLAGACVSSPPALAQPAPAQWGYSFVNGQATATYPGNATINGTTTLAGGLSGAITINGTGQMFQNNGAVIHRLQDRLFLGLATVNDGNFNNVTKDWLSTLETGWGNAQSYPMFSMLNSLTNNNILSGYGILGGAQTLNLGASGAAIGTQGHGICNQASNTASCWGFYGEAHRVVTGSGSAYGFEVDPVAHVASQTSSPNLQGNVVGGQYGCGGAYTGFTQFTCSAAMQVTANGSTFQTGLNVMRGSITGTNDAIQLPTGNGISFTNAAGNIGGRILGTFTGAVTANLTFDVNGLQVSSANGANIAYFFQNNNAVNYLAVIPGNTGVGVGLNANGTDTNINLTLSPKGTGTVAIGGGGLQLPKTTVASLPACAAGGEGSLYAVTDANSAVFNAAAAGGGTNHMIAYCNGTGWVVH